VFDGGRYRNGRPAILTEETGGSERESCLVENQMASDLSGLNARPLRQNQ